MNMKYLLPDVGMIHTSILQRLSGGMQRTTHSGVQSGLILIKLKTYPRSHADFSFIQSLKSSEAIAVVGLNPGHDRFNALPNL